MFENDGLIYVLINKKFNFNLKVIIYNVYYFIKFFLWIIILKNDVFFDCCFFCKYEGKIM